MNKTQQAIILSIMDWAAEHNEPIKRREIYERMKGVPAKTVEASMSVLTRRGYIRRAISVKREATYVLLRTIVRPVVSSPDYEEQEASS